MSKEAMNLALETLEVWKGYMPAVWDKTDEQAITALREALAEQPAQQEPVALMQEIDVLMLADSHGIDPSTKGLYNFYVDCISTSPLAQQEPVAWMFPDDLKRFETSEAYAEAYSIKMGSPTQGQTVPLYTSPPAQRTWVDLTDEEIEDIEITWEATQEWDCFRYAARAIEAKLKERNL